MDYQAMWEQLKEEIDVDRRFHEIGTSQAADEAVFKAAKCKEILKRMEELEKESQK